ncbi:hypothetical protein J0X14_13820 [Muricauda sp. CAU 1633]|uniref:hypothetical protein n=1 Tax=Allomuricauda sp. CAU 1633 TaxID=2816036 RepID=UPI001A8DF587|nr:hypothetical protein [Muricauda sp. CAU 1633]MBO0323382.1 hypothetical protein [Muricauda sp. CAU 1633]
MAPKSRVLVVMAILFAINATFSQQCDNYYSKVTYALNHCKKAMTATNFEHQMYYAERALTALEKADEFKGDCVCKKAYDKAYDTKQTLDKAIEPIDWEAGRFYTKKALGQINELITFLDECTLGVSSDVTIADSGNTTMVHEAHADNNTAEIETNTASENSMELEMIKVFEKHATDKLSSAEQAIAQLVELSKTIGANSTGSNDPNSLASHQQAYLEKAKKILEEGIKNLGGEE